VILIAFCFGAFLEGTGGGGAPVAIAGAFLIGLGFPHFQAATLCLLANTAPVAWGGVGNPIRVLNGVTGLPIHELNAMVGRILPPFSLILPAWLVVTMVGWRKALGVVPALVVSGASFAAMQFYWSNYQETGLVDIVAAIFSLLVMVAFLRFWKPRKLMEEGEGQRTIELRAHGPWAVFKGWSPFALASVFIFLWALPGFARYLKIPFLTFPTPWLDGLVIRTPPVVPVPTPETASIDVNFFALPGTAVFLGAFLAALLLGMGRRALRCSARRSASSCRRCSPSASWSASPTSRSTRGWTP
jgi:lactate permease